MHLNRMMRILGWVILALLLTSCIRQIPAMTPSPIQSTLSIATPLASLTETLQPKTATASAPFRTPTSESRTIQPTICSQPPCMYENPNEPTSAKTRIPSPTLFPSPTLPPTNTPFRIGGSIECTPQEDLLHCFDPILNIDFEYPANWGKVTTLYRSGQEGGAAYHYNFPSGIFEAGGRSKDFAESRGGMFSDFLGFGEVQGSLCSRYYWTYCEDIQADVMLNIQMNTADQNCSPGPLLGVDPVAIIVVNLPDNPRIGGFLFVAYFLSEELTNRLYQALECTNHPDNLPGCLFPVCSDEDKVKFDAIRDEILSGIANETIDLETKANLDILRRLAESIVIK